MEDNFKRLSREELIKLIIAMDAEAGRAVPGWWLGPVLIAAILLPWALLMVWVMMR